MVKYLLFFILTFNLAMAGGNKVIKHILPNKTTILYKQTNGKGIISGVIFIKGGSIEDPKGKSGLTSILMKMILKKSKSFTGFEINKHFEDSGGFISTSTAEEYSLIEFALKVEDFEKGINIIKDIIYNPVFEEEKLKQEIKNTISQIKAQQEEGFSYAFSKLRKLIYKDTPYEHPPIGEIKDLKSITVKDLDKRHKAILQGDRFIVSIVGDLEYKKAQPILKNAFYKLSDIPFSYSHFDIFINKTSTKTYKREGAQSTILVAYNAPVAGGKYYFEMKVLNAVLGNGFTSRLFQELREKQGLAYAVGSFYPTKINTGNLIAYIGTAPEKTEKSFKGIIDVVSSIKNGVSKEEIDIAKEKIIGHFLLDSQTRSKQAYYMGFFETIGLGYEMFYKYVENIQKVRNGDIINAYNTYLNSGYKAVIVKP